MDPQKLAKGQPHPFRLAIPKTVIECCYCLRGETAAPHRSAGPDQV